MKKRAVRIVFAMAALSVGFFCETGQGGLRAEAAVSAKVYKNTLHREKGKLYYYNSNGQKLKAKWKTVNGKRYYFKKNGAAACGVTRISGVRYVFSAKGVLQKKRFVTIDGKTYYANYQGRAVRGFRAVKGRTYCFNSKGVMRTGWYTKGGKTWYFSKKNGVMAVGFKRINGKKYYFDADGTLVKNAWVGERYIGDEGYYDAAQTKALKAAAAAEAEAEAAKAQEPVDDLSALRAQLESTVAGYSGTWSIYVKNLDTDVSFAINNRQTFSASLIKLYAMAAAYEKIEQGALSEAAVGNTLYNMIVYSDNTSFNSILRSIGTTTVNDWCRRNGYLDTNQGYGLYPASNFDGLSNGTGRNRTSAENCGRLLESIYRGTCVSQGSSQKMLSLLLQQRNRSKIPAAIPGTVQVANKTGETDDECHDAAIVYSAGADYVISVMVYAPGTAFSLNSKVTQVSRIVYNYFNS